MARDLRDLFQEDTKNQKANMSHGHEARFLQKLERELPKKKEHSKFKLLNIAASVVVLLGLAYGAFQIFPTGESIENNGKKPNEVSELKTLGDLSPDLKKVEDYYLASINLELSKVQLTPENKELVDGYMARLKELNDEYKRLTIELNENGLNEETLDAHINNLKLRLNLVTRLKTKIKEFNEPAFSEASI